MTIDLRSDTVTQPTPAMRRAMAEAELGDDVLGDDPTVQALERRVADLLGTEAALLVVSGTMGNLVCQLAHLQPGDEALVGASAHIVNTEAAGHAMVVGAAMHTLPERPDGTLDLDALRRGFRDPGHPAAPRTALVALENTHSAAMGRPVTPGHVKEVAELAREHGVPVHIDGARLFNAAVALDVAAADLVAHADSVTFCLSKGLSCPVGSVVAGSADLVARARRARKVLGGGMRQAGVLAAPGLVALDDGPDGTVARLADDHANARRLAAGLAALPRVTSPGGLAQPDGDGLDPDRVHTNLVLFGVDGDADATVDALAERGVRLLHLGHGVLRALTHRGVTAGDVDRALDIAADVLA